MTTLENNFSLTENPVKKLWGRIPVLVRAIFIGFIVNTIGTMSWPLFATFLPIPYAILTLAIFLVVYWKFFSGRWGPKASARERAANFRRTRLARPVWKWSLAAALLFVIVFQSGMMLTFRFVEFPAASFTQGNAFDALPIGLAAIAIFISAAVAGICEEVGFRGYMQAPLEKKYGPKIAILVVSIIFVLIHLHQAWLPPLRLHVFLGSVMFGMLTIASNSLVPAMIAHTLADVFNFAYWWSDVLGKYNQPLLSQSGIDAHFGLWITIFLLSTAAFLVAVKKTKMARLQTTA